LQIGQCKAKLRHCSLPAHFSAQAVVIIEMLIMVIVIRMTVITVIMMTIAHVMIITNMINSEPSVS